MTQSAFHVALIGGGIGGLCLAQGLKKAGIRVAVYERDRTPTDRLQGYRVHINNDGSRALHECLPPHLFRGFVATAGKPTRRVTILDERLRVLLSVDFPEADPEAVDSPRGVSRMTIRRLLLQGLDGLVHFDKRFARFEDSSDGRVVAHFEDGTSAVCDLLIGADGANSRVRKQLLPHAQRIETGLFSIAGKIRLDETTRPRLPRAIFDGPTPIMGPRGRFLFSTAVEFRHDRPEWLDSLDRPEAAAPLHGGLLFDDESDYAMWGFSTRREAFSFPAPPETLSGRDLQAVVLTMIDGWHPALQFLVRESDPSTVNTFSVRTSVPIPPWPTGNVTLLGDAIHNMTPYRGVGANTALRDAALLCRNLTLAHRGERPLLKAIHDYESEMLCYGFDAVRTSLRSAEMFHNGNPFRRSVTKTFLRTVNTIQSLRRRLSAAN
jgi:2-polyprenyl-6-methoxyphenol hydroxylase-like FAD-dependent oxidoreductase